MIVMLGRFAIHFVSPIGLSGRICLTLRKNTDRECFPPFMQRLMARGRTNGSLLLY